MKKLILVAISGLFFAANSNAQVQRKMAQHQHMTSDSTHHFQKRKMMQDLNLTDDQKTQLKSMRQGMKQQHEAIQKDASLSADQKKEKMKALHQTQMQKMNAILTPEQQAKMKTFRQQRMQNPKMQKGHKMMKDQLALSAEQKTQMKGLQQETKQQREAIKNDATLTPDQKKQKMKELHQSQSDKMNAILTPDQQAKRKTLMAERKQNHKMNGKKIHEKRNADSTMVQ